jgi:hypothetical protein
VLVGAAGAVVAVAATAGAIIGAAVGAAGVAAGAQAASSSVQMTTKLNTLNFFILPSPLTNLAKKIEAPRFSEGFYALLQFLLVIWAKRDLPPFPEGSRSSDSAA